MSQLTVLMALSDHFCNEVFYNFRKWTEWKTAVIGRYGKLGHTVLAGCWLSLTVIVVKGLEELARRDVRFFLCTRRRRL